MGIKNVSNRKIGVMLSYVMMILEVLSTLLITPFIIRTLGQAEYGVYKLSAAIVAYLLLLDLGVGNAVIRYMSKYRAAGEIEEVRRFQGITTVYYGAIAAITLTCGYILIYIYPTVFAKGLSPDEIKLGQTLLNITIWNAAITLATTAYANTIIAYEHFAFSRLISIGQIIFKMVLTVVVLNMGMGSVGIMVTNLIMTIVYRGACVLFVLFKLKLKPLFNNMRLSFVKEVFLYSSWILLQMIATQINASAGQVMLGMLVNSAVAIIAIYSIGTQIVQYFQSIGSAFTDVLMPGVVRIVEKGASPEQLCNEMTRIGRIILMVLMLIWSCFLVFGKQFVILWAGELNESAYIVALFLMFAYMMTSVQSIGNQILWAKNQHKEQALLKIAVVLINVIITSLLIKRDALLSVTIGTFISLLLGDVFVMNIVFKKKIGIKLKAYYVGLFKGILPCVAATIIAGYLFTLFGFSGWIGFIINVAEMCMVYAVVMWFFGMNEYEKNLVMPIIKKLKLNTQ